MSYYIRTYRNGIPKIIEIPTLKKARATAFKYVRDSTVVYIYKSQYGKAWAGFVQYYGFGKYLWEDEKGKVWFVHDDGSLTKAVRRF